MRPFRTLLLVLTALSAACQNTTDHALLPVEPAAAPALGGGGSPSPWTVTTLALPAGVWISSAATGINDSGRVVGYVTVSGAKYRPVRWINGVPSFMVVTTSDHWAIPNAINNNGDVVGQIQWISGNLSQPVKPARWLNPGTIQTLSTLGWDGWAMDINSARTAVGTSRATSGGQQRAVKWNAAGTITSLHPVGATWSRAFGINEQGEIVGVANFPDGTHGWKWLTNNASIDLGLVFNAVVPEINSTSEAVGTALFNGLMQAVVWTPNGTKLTLSAGTGSFATSISDARRSIGVNGSAAWTSRFEVPVVTLPAPSGAGSSYVRDVNRCGRIVGHAAGGSLSIQVPALWTPAVCDP
jgi:uncharacterized membrane protein